MNPPKLCSFPFRLIHFKKENESENEKQNQSENKSLNYCLMGIFPKPLADRAILSLSPSSKKCGDFLDRYLQNLITNNVLKFSPKGIHSLAVAFLNAKVTYHV